MGIRDANAAAREAGEKSREKRAVKDRERVAKQAAARKDREARQAATKAKYAERRQRFKDEAADRAAARDTTVASRTESTDGSKAKTDALRAEKAAREETRSASVAEQRKSRNIRRQKISKAGDTANGTLACPKCGGQQFTAKRSKKGKTIGVLTVGVGVVAAPKSQVKCVTCGTMYKRG